MFLHILIFNIAYFDLAVGKRKLSQGTLSEIHSYRYPDVRTSGNKLVVNLAISDAIMHLKSWVLIVNGFHGGPILGGFGKRMIVCP
jgi:hypothetical protein